VEYKLPQNILQQIKDGKYTLLVQKQSGTLGHALNLDLDFGAYNVESILPASLGIEVLGGNHFKIASDLKRDKNFEVLFDYAD